MSPPPPRPPLQPLPIDEVLPQLLSALEARGSVLLKAPTGAGKTTRVPSALLDRLPADRSVVLIEPRRIAARATARRIARERGVELGEEVGYRVRFDDRTSARTRLFVETEGVFLRRLQRDPFLEGVDTVVLDEFHERSLQADLALALSRRVQSEAREDLRLVVMSATLETSALGAFLPEAALVESEGRLFPVEEHYLSTADRPRRDEPLTRPLARAVRRALSEREGDVLVFLPGVGEIRQLAGALASDPSLREVDVLELYGDLAPREQDRVFEPSARRKVVLATNIAETSLTIPGITAVVDSGLARRLVHDPALGLDRLELVPISRASARQRAGRAGRTAPGSCYRMWTAADERGRLEEDVPEVRRAELSGAALELACFGETRLEEFPWFEAPPSSSLATARALLVGLGALEARDDASWRATDLGRRLNALPLAPRLGRLLLEGAEAGVAREAATCAALLSERPPFRRRDPRGPLHTSPHDSDWLDAVYAIEEFERTGRTSSSAGELLAGPARGVLRTRDQLLRLVRDRRTLRDVHERDEATLKALFTAFPDRLARRREPHGETAVLVGGRGVKLGRESGVREAELFVCVDLDAGGTESLVRRASRVDPAWLDPALLEQGQVLEFDARQERVVATQVTSYLGLALESRPLPTPREPEVAAVLHAAALRAPERALDLNEPEVSQWLARVACLREWREDLELPSPEELQDRALESLCAERTSFAELRKAPLFAALEAGLAWELARELERLAPRRLEVPSGSFITLTYEPGRPPILAARIQELFGLAETPRVCRGEVPVLLHLLAPNMRPQQVTADLASFWNTTYAEVRKELRRRYPKHSWPEDPWTAEAVRGARRRRS